jgi:hypothetical protein
VDGTGSGSCSVTGFGISDAEILPLLPDTLLLFTECLQICIDFQLHYAICRIASVL